MRPVPHADAPARGPQRHPACGIPAATRRCAARVRPRALLQGRHRRGHRRHRRPAARHGLRHRQRRQARTGPDHRDRRRLPDRRARRIERADRRAGRRVHRHRLRHPRALWAHQPADLDRPCRRRAVPARAVQARRAGALRAGVDHHRLHQRHRGADRLFAAARPARAAHRQAARGLLRATAVAVAAPRHLQPVRIRHRGDVLRRPVPLAADVEDRRPAGAHPRRTHDPCGRAHPGAGGRAGLDHRDRRAARSAGGDHRHALRRHPADAARSGAAAFLLDLGQGAAVSRR